MNRITNEQFQLQVLEIHGQYLQLLGLQKSGKNSAHNFQLLHSCLTNLISMLSEGQKTEMFNILSQAVEIRKQILSNCSEEYKSNLKKQTATSGTKSRFEWEGCGGGERIF